MGKLIDNIGRLFLGIVMAGAFSLAFGDNDFFLDLRDGQVYRTVRIGGLTWMAENLNYNVDNSWCYDEDSSNCEKYGRLYTWRMAMEACPSGWHLPEEEEWDNLLRAVRGYPVVGIWGITHWSFAGKRLKSKTGWNDYEGESGNGTDDFGFSALPGGSAYDYRCGCGRNDDDYGYYGVGKFGGWWTATTKIGDEGDAARPVMGYDHGYVKPSYGYKGQRNAVRCVKDE